MKVINDIHFSCNVLQTDAKEKAEQSITVQFKTSMMESWTNLVTGEISETGIFEATYVIPERIAKSDVFFRGFREIIEAGGVPNLRLVQNNELPESTVLVQSGDSKYNGKGTLEFVFDEVTLIEESLWSNIATREGYNEEFKVVSKLETPLTNDAITELQSLKTVVSEQEQQIRILETDNDSIETIMGPTELVEDDLPAPDSGGQGDGPLSLLEQYEADNHSLEQTIELNVDTINQLTTQVSQLETDMVDRDNLIANQEDQIGVLNDQITALQQTDGSYEAKAVPASTVYSSILGEVQKVKETAIDSRFRIANLSFNLKTTLEQDDAGTRIKLLDSESATSINPNAISEMNFSIVDDATTSDLNSSEKTPLVLGLTETAVRKKLQTYGLRLNPVYEYNSTHTIGQAFQQTPTPDEIFNPNQLVTVVFSKK